MKHPKTLFLLAASPLLCGPAFAQYKMVSPLSRKEAEACAQRSLQPQQKVNSNTAPRPTGTLQRLIRTESRLTNLQAPDFHTNDSMFYFYSGDRATQTPLPGPYGRSRYDTAYSVLHGTYASQKFYSSGLLKSAIMYFDMSPGSGPGAYQHFRNDYDAQGRLLLDSFAQAGQAGANLDWKYRYAFDGQGRLSHTEYYYNAYDFNGNHYGAAAWKKYNNNDTLAAQDSVITADNGSTTIRIIKHTYNSYALIVADSSYAAGIPGPLPVEATQYTYPQPGTCVATTSRFENNAWQLALRYTSKKDMQGRHLLDQYEEYLAGTWQKLTREEKQYTYAHQPDSLPTEQIYYHNDGSNNWSASAKYLRTFNNDELIDTLYQYDNLDQPAPRHPNFVTYTYNGHRNLVRVHQHLFMEDGTEITGYYTDHFYEIATGLTGPRKNILEMQVYPNPATTTLHIKTAAEQALELRITDQGGHTLAAESLKGPALSLDIRSLTPGTYYVQIRDKKTGSSGVAVFVKK